MLSLLPRILCKGTDWGLRDYGTAKWEGGNIECDHINQQKLYMCSSVSADKRDEYAEKLLGNQFREVCGKCGAVRIDSQIGLEKTPEEYVAKMVAVFREVRRVLKKEGTLWLNLGDSYTSTAQGTMNAPSTKIHHGEASLARANYRPFTGLKPKDLVGIPWRVAFALQADGWYLRQDIIWCLSGGTFIYAKTQKGVMPVMIRDIARLKPNTVQLWNGEKWTNIIGISKSKRKNNEIELVLRSGERISCSPSHKFPTYRGLLEAKEIKNGDILRIEKLPDTENPRDCAIDEDAGWLAGLYIADGSRSGDCIQIAGHSKEKERWERLQKIAKKYGGYITRTINKNKMDIRLYGKVLNAIINELVSGRTAKDKGFSTSSWNYSNKFIKAMLDGYLSGDGCWENKNNRWRLGFTRNYNLERDLRTACARLGYKIVLNLSSVKYNSSHRPTFRGEIRKEIYEHHNNKKQSEVVEIRKARCREIYDIGVEEPHLFSLASGILTHNSKPNPMPESVTDRCTKSHEYVFLLSKNPKYYYDAEAIKEDSIDPESYSGKRQRSESSVNILGGFPGGDRDHFHKVPVVFPTRNRRSVWTITTKPFREAHFATFPEDLVEPMIKAGTSEKGICPDCGKAWVRIIEVSLDSKTKTLGWKPSCDCGKEPVPAVVLDPFAGSGTALVVAKRLGRNYLGIELNPEYVKMAERSLISMRDSEDMKTLKEIEEGKQRTLLEHISNES